MRYGVLTAILTAEAATVVGCSHTATTSTTTSSAAGTTASAKATTSSAPTGPMLMVTIAGGKATPTNAGKVEVELHHLDQTVATIDVTP